MGGWAILGRNMELTAGALFVTYQQCRGYIRYIRERVAPVLGKFPDLARFLHSDKETRTVWATLMSTGMTLGQAIVAGRA